VVESHNRMPKVSVLIPNYNHTRYIDSAIQSVLNQSYQPFEVIVVDDGSTDNSREVVAQFGNQVRYIWQENQGLAGARNTGICAAKGELIALLDADDVWYPKFLETMISLAAKRPDAAVYYCGAQGMDSDSSDLPQVFGGPVMSPETIYEHLLRGNFLIPSTIVMRRSVVTAAGLFDQNLRSCEDWDLWLRLLPEHLFIGTCECLVRYRLHKGSLSANPNGMQQAAQTVIEKHFGSNDGQPHAWSAEKRRAYGGLYRYHLLTSLQRKGDWQAGALYFRQALQADPTLATDLDLFYDLALGTQPVGYRGTTYQLDLEANALGLRRLMKEVLGSTGAPTVKLHRRALGTAYYALGIVAYNTGKVSLGRHFFVSALYQRPELCREALLVGNLVKSWVGRPWLKRMKACAERVRKGPKVGAGNGPRTVQVDSRNQ